jgi:hypothetical protein
MKASAIGRAYAHWEAWAGVLLCGLCAGVGGYLSGLYFSHSIIPPALGGGIGGYFQSRILDYVIRRYGLDTP